MKKRFVVLVLGIGIVFLGASLSQAGGMFVATAKNLRGALYQGFGPSPAHATEQALVKCSQDSFIPPSCRVVCVRLECPPPMVQGPPPLRKPIRKTMSQAYPGVPAPGYSPMGRPTY
jgi:hypothetical protein